jgi:predicted dehydrogenase
VTDEPLGVAMIGYAFMGAAHSQGWRNAHRFFDLPVTPTMSVVCGRSESATREAADKLGWASWTTDWRDVLTRDDVQVVDICTPGDSRQARALREAAGQHRVGG